MPSLYNTGQGYGEDGWMDYWLNNDPQAAYGKFGNIQKNQNLNYKQWLNNQSGRYRTQYLGQTYDEPNLLYPEYLGRQNPEQEYAQLSPRQRGEAPGNYVNRLRWVNF